MKKTVCRIIAVAIFLTVCISSFASVSASTVSKNKKTYEISVVFDNSGSMYKNEGWSRAKYAMEIFASMLNYNNGDKLRIYPMWEVTTDGSTPDVGGGSYAAIEIGSKSDIDKISNLFTVNPGNTPFEPIKEAYEYMKSSSATDKWLIVLTDGAFNLKNRSDKKTSAVNLDSEFSAISGKGVNIQYLGFGKATVLESQPSRNFYAKNSTDTSLKDDLVGICNSIFQRSILPASYLSGSALTVDLSMKNIIVFAQGANAKVTGLVNSSGERIKVSLDSGQRTYNEIRANYYPNAPVDRTLAGQVVTFEGCPRGEYTLEYSGVDSIQIFYEPDVDIEVSILNGDNQPITKDTKPIVAGDYTVSSKIVDRYADDNEKDVTNHPLLGNDVHLTTKVKTSSEGEYKEYENGATITLGPDSSTDILIEGTYLKDYKISSKGNHELDWLGAIKVEEPGIKVEVIPTVEQSGAWYKLSERDTWKPIKVKLTADGVPMTREQLEKTTFTVSPDIYFKELLPDESSYVIYITKDRDGNDADIEEGKYKLSFSASIIDEYGKENVGSAESSFEVSRYGKLLTWLLRNLWWILALIIIIILIVLFMTQKVLPKGIIRNTAKFRSISAGDLGGDGVEVRYNKKSKTLSINGPTGVAYDEQCQATLSLRPIDRRYKSSARRGLVVVGINSSCEEVRLGAVQYVKVNGQWVAKSRAKAVSSAGAKAPVIQQELSPNARFTLIRAPGGVNYSTLECSTKTR